jgi:thiol-disulfide isomerase/thioredoxin
MPSPSSPIRGARLSLLGVGALLLASLHTGASALAPNQTPPADAPPAAPAAPEKPAAPAERPQRERRAPAAAAAPGGGQWPANYFFDGSGPRFANLIGKAPPAITARDWTGEAIDPRSLKGKVVVVDFWATWCSPCMRAIPHMVDLVKQHEKDGLVVIGVHDGMKGWTAMADVAKNKSINYPLCIDEVAPNARAGRTATAYRVGFWPTIVIIDRAGKVRAGGVQPAFVDEIVADLLKEPAPEGASAPAAPAKPAEPAAPATPATPAAPTAPAAPTGGSVR